MKTWMKIALAAGLALGVSTVSLPEIAFGQAAAEVAAAAAPAPQGPALEMIGPIVAFLKSIPTVGPVLTVVLEVIGIIAAVMTLLSAFLLALFRLPELGARWAGAHDLADKIEAISSKVLPILQYLSMFNVQKKPAPASFAQKAP
jgi:uncharacterized membrane protein